MRTSTSRQASTPSFLPTRAAETVFVGDVHAAFDSDPAVDDHVLFVPAVVERQQVEAGVVAAHVDTRGAHEIEDLRGASVAADAVDDHPDLDPRASPFGEVTGQLPAGVVAVEDEGLQVDR